MLNLGGAGVWNRREIRERKEMKKRLVVDSWYEWPFLVFRRRIRRCEAKQSDGLVEKPIYFVLTSVIMHYVDFCRLLSFFATLYSQDQVDSDRTVDKLIGFFCLFVRGGSRKNN